MQSEKERYEKELNEKTEQLRAIIRSLEDGLARTKDKLMDALKEAQNVVIENMTGGAELEEEDDK
jgi:hypothetical protein